MSALCDGGLFVDRVAKDTLAATSSSPAYPGETLVLDLLPRSPFTSDPDVQVTLGLDKGNDPGTVKFMASTVNQAHQRSQSNTILVGVYLCSADKHDELPAMLATHLPQMDVILRDGLIVHGARRPLRLIIGSDCAVQCCDLGNKGPTGRQPCMF